MIDNYDSFTYNLVQYLGELGAEVETVRNDAVGIADIIGRQVMRTGGKWEFSMIIVIMITGAVLSSFMNNIGDHKLANNNVTRSEKDGVTAHVV